MSMSCARRPLLLLTSLVLAGALPAIARADFPVGQTAAGTPVVADAGSAVWRGDDGRLVVRQGQGPVKTTNLRPPASAIFDIGTRRGGGGAQIAWAESCSTRSRACAVRSAILSSAALNAGRLSARVVAHVPYRGGGSPAIAVDGARLAYAVRSGSCDVPYLRTLPSSSARRLDRGHCARLTQLDTGDGYVALLARPTATPRATEARVVRTGGGPSRTLQRESQGEESNFIGAVSLDRGALFTARGGIRQPNVFTRLAPRGGGRSDVRAFVDLQGAFARDRGRVYYAQTESFESSTECGPARDAPGCLVVAGDDPFGSAARTLSPELALTVAPQPVFVDTPASAVATLTRRTVTRTAVTATAPVAGVPVELLAATPAAIRDPAPVPAPTGRRATTGADGTATIAIPGPAAPFRYLAAVTRPAAGVAIPTRQSTYLPTYARLTASATRLADGRLRVTGTISPALPGRKVRLDRRLDRICNQNVTTPGAVASPSQAGVPAGCFDRYTQDPVATAAVSADGASYAVDASTPPGTYRVALDFAGGALVFPGESTGFAAP
jgi:hypothetical protein